MRAPGVPLLDPPLAHHIFKLNLRCSIDIDEPQPQKCPKFTQFISRDHQTPAAFCVA